MADPKELVRTLQDIATKNNPDRSPEMMVMQALANGIMHCLLKLDGIEKTQTQMLNQMD